MTAYPFILLLVAYLVDRFEEATNVRFVWLDVLGLACLFGGWFLLWFNFGLWVSR